MSHYVYKFRLMPGTPVRVEMPKYSHVVHVGSQDDGPVLWAIVDTEQPMETREFWVYGTGHLIDVERPKVHVGSCHTEAGLVWHVFEADKDREWAEGLFKTAAPSSEKAPVGPGEAST